MKCKISVTLTIITVIIILFLGILYLPFILHVFSSDEKMMDTSDLRLYEIKIKEQENAYADLKMMETLLPPDDYPNPDELLMLSLINKKWDKSAAQKLIAKYTLAFASVESALKKIKFQDPTFADPETITIATKGLSSIKWLTLSKLFAIKAKLLAEKGQIFSAFKEARKFLIITDMVQDSNCALLTYSASSAGKREIINAMNNLSMLFRSDPVKIVEAAALLSDHKNRVSDLENAIKVEYIISTKQVEDIDKQYNTDKQHNVSVKSLLDFISNWGKDMDSFGSNRFYFKPNKTKNEMTRRYRNLIDCIEEPCCKEYKDEVKPFVVSIIEAVLTENAIGKSLQFYAYTPTYRKAIQRFFKLNNAVSTLQLTLAFEAFKIKNGKYPDKLEKLIPEYLPEIPVSSVKGDKLDYASVVKNIEERGPLMKMKMIYMN